MKFDQIPEIKKTEQLKENLDKEKAPTEENQKNKILLELIQTLKRKYIDKEGNIRKYKAIYLGATISDNFITIFDKEIDDLFEKLTGNKDKSEYSEPIGPCNIYNEIQNDLLLNKINNINEKLIDRIIFSQIIGDAAIDFIEDDYDMYGHAIIEDLKKCQNHQLPFLLKVYLRKVIEECSEYDYWEEWEQQHNENKENEENQKNNFKLFDKIIMCHDKNYDTISFDFNPDMETKINDDAFHGSYFKNLYPIQLIENNEKEIDSPIYIYSGDGEYISTEICPGVLGIYSLSGNLIAWKETKKVVNLNENSKNNKIIPEMWKANITITNEEIKNLDKTKEKLIKLKIIKNLLENEKIKKLMEKENIDIKFSLLGKESGWVENSLNLNIYQAKNDDKSEKKLNTIKNTILNEARSVEIDEADNEDSIIKELIEKFGYEKGKLNFKQKSEYPTNKIKLNEVIELMNNIQFDNPTEDIVLLKLLLSLPFRVMVKEKIGMDINKLDLKYQYYFLNYIKDKTDTGMDEIAKFISCGKNEKDKNNRLKSFLSIEHGGKEMGNKILEIGEKLPEDVAQKVFAKFEEIIDSVDEVINIINKRFGKEIDNSSIVDSIRINLLKKGSDLLLESSQIIFKNNSSEEFSQIGKEILERLENSKHEAILLGAAFKSVSQDKIKLNEIKDITLESTNEKEKLSQYQEEMSMIFKDNRINYPKELLEETTKEFTEVLKNPENKEFFILKDKENILGFMRFDKLENGNLYAGSLNTRNEIHGLAIGGALLKELLIKKSKENNIEAVVYEKNPMLKKYTTEYGFKITGEIENYKNTGEKFYKIEIPKGSLKDQAPTSNTKALSQAA